MDFQWSAEEETFRQELREFLQEELPEGWGITQFWDPDDDRQFAFVHTFTKKLGARNWLAVSWPQAYGGLDWPFWKQFIFNEELANFDAPVVGRNATRFLGPTIFRYGTEEQKRQHIPATANSDPTRNGPPWLAPSSGCPWSRCPALLPPGPRRFSATSLLNAAWGCHASGVLCHAS